MSGAAMTTVGQEQWCYPAVPGRPAGMVSGWSMRQVPGGP